MINQHEITIERCPHDEENPYTMIRNDLIRDESLSPNCRWLLTYLLSNKSNWKINVVQLTKHVKPHFGKGKVLKLIKEAIEGGYMMLEEYQAPNPKGGSLKRVRYLLSESAKFKKCYRRVENQDAGYRDVGRTNSNNNIDKEGISSCSTPLTYNHSTTHTPPAPPESAFADGGGGNASHRRLKKSDFAPEVLDLSNRMIAILQRENPAFRPPNEIVKFYSQVRSMLERDGQSADLILEVFEWGASDIEERGDFKGWQSVLCSKNAAETFRKHFAKIYSQMRSRPKRGFLPSSDDDAAYRKICDLASRAI